MASVVGVAEYQRTLTNLYKTPKQPELVYWKAAPEGEREQRSLSASGASLGRNDIDSKHGNGSGNGNPDKYSSSSGNGNGKHNAHAVEGPDSPTSNGINSSNGKMQLFYIQQQQPLSPIHDSSKIDPLGLPAQHQGLASKAVPPLPPGSQASAPDTARDQQTAGSIKPSRADPHSTPALPGSTPQAASYTPSEGSPINGASISQQQVVSPSTTGAAPDALSPTNGASMNDTRPAPVGFFATAQPRTGSTPQSVDWQSQPDIAGFFDNPSSPQPVKVRAGTHQQADSRPVGSLDIPTPAAADTSQSKDSQQAQASFKGSLDTPATSAGALPSTGRSQQARRSSPLGTAAQAEANNSPVTSQAVSGASQPKLGAKPAAKGSNSGPGRLRGFFDRPLARDDRTPTADASNGTRARHTGVLDAPQARQSAAVTNEGLSRARGFFDAPQARDATKAAGDVSNRAPVRTRGFFDASQARDAPKPAASASSMASAHAQQSPGAPNAKQDAGKPAAAVTKGAAVRHQGFVAASPSKAGEDSSSQRNDQNQPALKSFFDMPSSKPTLECEADVKPPAPVSQRGFFDRPSRKAAVKPEGDINRPARQRETRLLWQITSADSCQAFIKLQPAGSASYPRLL